MNRFALVVPGDIAAPTGGYGYDREVLAACRGDEAMARHVALPDGFPFPTAAVLAESARRLDALPPGEPLLIDGLALGALPADWLAARARPIVGLVHHPLARETGLSAPAAAALAASERAALRQVRAVVTTSRATADELARDYGVPHETITVAEPGLARHPAAALAGNPPHVLAVGSLIARKGYSLLIDALAAVADLPWRATIAGAADRDGEEARRIAGRVAGHGLGPRIDMPGAVPATELAALYHSADLFVLASLYEGYGMVVAEAMAHGLAIVATRTGLLAAGNRDDLVTIEPGDAPALAAALRRLLADRAERRRLGAAAHRSARAMPGWDETARRIAAVMRNAGG